MLRSAALLEVDGVSKSFKGLVAVKNLTLQVNQGEIVGLIGPNGAGKTTAFNIIAGIHSPDSGEVRFMGKRISGRKPHQISRLGISRTFQIAKPFVRMTVLENALTGSLFAKEHHMTIRRSQSIALDALKYVGLEQKAHVLASELTLADQRKLELARTIAAKPRLLMLDEIMAGLNQREISDTLGLLRRLNKDSDIAILIIEHVMSAIMQLCDRIIVMNHGEKLAEGNSSEIVNNIQVVEAYMGRSRSHSGSTAVQQEN